MDNGRKREGEGGIHLVVLVGWLVFSFCWFGSVRGYERTKSGCQDKDSVIVVVLSTQWIHYQQKSKEVKFLSWSMKKFLCACVWERGREEPANIKATIECMHTQPYLSSSIRNAAFKWRSPKLELYPLSPSPVLHPLYHIFLFHSLIFAFPRADFTLRHQNGSWWKARCFILWCAGRVRGLLYPPWWPAAKGNFYLSKVFAFLGECHLNNSTTVRSPHCTNMNTHMHSSIHFFIPEKKTGKHLKRAYTKMEINSTTLGESWIRSRKQSVNKKNLKGLRVLSNSNNGSRLHQGPFFWNRAIHYIQPSI